MSEEQQEGLIDFELTFGLKKDGEIHRTGQMREPTVQDWIDLSNDLEIKGIGREHGHLPMGNTLGALIANGPIYKVYAIIIAKHIVKLGTLDSVTRADILTLKPADLDYLIATFSLMQAAGAHDNKGEQKPPLASTSSSDDASAQSES